MQFVYVMDPMCGWCYGFQPELDDFLAEHPAAELVWIMGGLAPDSQTPMDEALRETIASYWHQIEAKTRVTFNHEFWTRNTPYRSTYPACRAVIAAEQLQAGSARSMVKAIQSAYYREARNPALEATLIACAGAIGFDEAAFAEVLASAETEQRFQQQLALTRRLQVRGFPALFFVDAEGRAYPLAMGYTPADEMAQRLGRYLENTG
ncbi:MAG: DsbA family protein [Pseudomonadota bacterium]